MTLIDLLAAITIAGLVLLSAALLLDGVADSAKRIAIESGAIGADGAGASELRELFGGAVATFDTTSRFEGDERALEFSTRCPAPEGWLTRCRAVLTIAEGHELRVRRGTSPWRRLHAYGADARLGYFDARRGEWRKRWSSSASIPDAVGVIVASDTLIYSVGPSRE
jgi:hypothetical protein